MKRIFSITLLFLLALVAWMCRDKPRNDPEDYSTMPLFCDYRITGDGEANEVTVLMQFRAGGPDGPGILLEKPASIRLDGYEIEADSSRMFGVYYEQRWLAHEFHGPHVLQYVNREGDTLMEKFTFPVFDFANPFPEKMEVADYEIALTGLAADDSLHLIVMDTSYLSRGIDRYLRLRDHKFLLSANDLLRLHKGPIILEIYRDAERDLRQADEEGGKIAISYAIRQRFILE